MARFLFVSPPFAGHINPTVSVGQALRERGHRVAWVGYGEVLHRLLPREAQIYALESRHRPEQVNALAADVRSVRGLRNLKLMWTEIFIPMARDMAPGTEQAVHSFRPDVLIVDQQALAGAMVARRLGLTWATSATSPVDRVRALSGLPKVLAWTEGQLRTLQEEVGLEAVDVPEESPSLVLLFSTPELAGPIEGFPPQYRMVGPAFESRRAPVAFPWERLGAIPRVLITLGSLNAERGRHVFELAREALSELPIQVIMAAPESFGPFPDNFICQAWLPQIELLAKVDLVVCHGGNNTVSETLAHGLPLVVIPITDDQPQLAHRVEAAGCGLRLSYARLSAERLRDGVRRVLAEQRFRIAAEAVRCSFEAAGGAARAAELLEQLAQGTPR